MIGIVSLTEFGAALATRLTTDGREVLVGSDDQTLAEIGRRTRLVLVDAPLDAMVDLGERLGRVLDGNHLVVHTVSGLSVGRQAGDMLLEATAVRRIGVIGGPAAPDDLRAGQPTAAVVASHHPEVVEEFAAALSTPRLRVYRGRDPAGVELAAGVGTLVALGAGLTDGLGLGEATRSLLLVRAVRELARLLGAVGADPATASGLAGLGTFVMRLHDRGAPGYQLGVTVGKGATIPSDGHIALRQTAAAVQKLVRGRRVTAFLFDGLSDLVSGRMPVGDILAHLMQVPVMDD